MHPHSTAPYARVARAGKPVVQRERILEEFDRQGVPLNRRMISELTGIPINVVCWRVKTLLESDMVRVAYSDVDPVTEAETEYLEPVPVVGKQVEMKL
jgi:hypothetical protein